MSEQPVLAGRYRVERELGRGGMAKVYLGADTVLGRQVAIKLLAPQFAEDESFVQRFRREAQAAARLSNPNVVSVFDTGTDGGVHFIVMEYVEGRTLEDYLAGGGRIMPDRALEIAEDVCGALSAAHAQGVIHRDIKPGNIMLTPSGQVKVADFGIARMTTTAETVAQTAAVLGTASYLSPEQAQGEPVDGRSDIYSLGCVLYEMVTGRPPFLGDSPVAVASKHVLEQPTLPSKLNRDVSPDLDAVILRAMAKNAANRYQTAEELRSDLERVRRGLPVETTPLLAPPPPAATQVMTPAGGGTQVMPPPEPERSRWWIPVLAIGGILLAIALLLWLFASDILGGDETSPTPALIEVPDVVGDRVRVAEETLIDAGLTVAEERIEVPVEDPTTEVPGTVVEQDPPALEMVPGGTEVTLTVLVAPDSVSIPPTEGLSPEDAQAALEAAGFVVAGFEDQASDTGIPEGQVIGTDPAAGTDAPFGSEVTILVSTGPGQVTVPDVICSNLGQAKGRIQDEGLVPIVADETLPPNPQCPNGTKVVDTDPAPFTEVETGSRVLIFLPGGGPTGPTGPTGDD
ncbi:MAG TPA: Stk1 family PASTA domain-containing Ser/Thr kinase [Actinomycetota bacterium]|nr:Stk1 family PASTA domain-containing Ser/Thr kinase [Actinomycetota bacterium]